MKAKEINAQVLKIFGLPETTTNAIITLEVGKFPTVECRHLHMTAFVESKSTLQSIGQDDLLGR